MPSFRLDAPKTSNSFFNSFSLHPTAASMSLFQDAIGQLPILKTYNHGTLGFKVPDKAAQETMIRTLQIAVEKVTFHFPWLVGAIINEGSGPGNSGLFKPVPWPATAKSPNNILRIKHYEDSPPSYVEILQAGAPCSMLDGKMLAPFDGFPARYEDSPENPGPIIAVQANFVNGGLLTFSAQHNIIDASGLMQIIKLFATALNGDEFTSQAIEQGNRDRTTVIPLIGPEEPMKNLKHLKLHEPLSPPPQVTVLPGRKPTWAYFRFSSSAVPGIKAMAMEPEGYDTSVPFISSNDALGAFYWKCISALRMGNGRSPESTSKFSRAIDSRRAMGVPFEYMGHMVSHSGTRLTLKEIDELPLSAVTRRLRKDLNDANNAISVRSYATLIANEPNKSLVLYGGGLFSQDVDIGSSTVSQAEFFVSFGPLGVPQFVRRPNLAPILGCVYFMPPENGDLMVLVCLREDDLEGLKSHTEWSKVTEFVG